MNIVCKLFLTTPFPKPRTNILIIFTIQTFDKHAVNTNIGLGQTAGVNILPNSPKKTALKKKAGEKFIMSRKKVSKREKLKTYGKTGARRDTFLRKNQGKNQ